MYCRLRPVVGYAMASLRQRSAAPVAGGSSRFCMQTDRVAEHLGDTLFKFVAGTLAMLLGFLRPLAIPFITNEWMCREEAESAPAPPLKLYCRQISGRSWESSTT